MRRLVLVGCLASVGGGWLASTPLRAQAPGPQSPPAVTVAKPVVKDVQDVDDYIGRFEAIERVDVRARVQGYLAQIHFTDGSLVKSGDLLFTIDQRPYKLAVEQAQSTVTSGQARLDFAQSDLDRAEQLRRTGTITEQTTEQRRQTFLTAQSDLSGGRAALADAKLNLEFTEIRSPINGRISQRLVTQGNLVAANTSVLTTIVSVDPIYFNFDIDERSYLGYAGMAAQGMRSMTTGGPASEATILLTDANLPPRNASLNFSDNRIDDASGTLRVRASVPNPDGFLVPGLFGRIAVAGSPPYRAALVPDEAIGTDQDRRVVYVVAPDGTVRSQTVRPGPRQDGYRVIRQGLQGDETIVVVGIQRARPGQKVTPKEITLPAVRERETPLPQTVVPPNAPPSTAAGATVPTPTATSSTAAPANTASPSAAPGSAAAATSGARPRPTP